MNIIDRWFNLQEKKLPVAEPNPSQPEPQPTPQPISQPTPASNADNTPPAEWERRYLRHLLTHDNQLPLALIDSREADDRSTPLLFAGYFYPVGRAGPTTAATGITQ
ncbi:MAG: hypothetical protein M5U34_12515 [Chloroflexi bacterium]|nr:hypothetical protein [Chloroflexota bacterium]